MYRLFVIFAILMFGSQKWEKKLISQFFYIFFFNQQI